jgi:acylphosphatase
MNPRIVRHAIIKGRVQGCGYRVWTERQALARDVEGWVRNRRDGTVEAVFAGTPEAVDAVLAKCRQGPPFSLVTHVEVHEGSGLQLAAKRSAERFSLLPTV